MEVGKKYDLKDRARSIPGHANPIEIRLGPYLVKTCNVKETVHVIHNSGPKTNDYFSLDEYYIWAATGEEPNRTPEYQIEGKLSVAREEPLKIMGHEIPIRETIWKCSIDARTYDERGQLYQPKYLAKKMAEKAGKVKSAKNQGIELDQQQLEALLSEALSPYVKRAEYFCGKGRPLRPVWPYFGLPYFD